jgi:hypothetical protein
MRRNYTQKIVEGLFKPGPLHDSRRELYDVIKNLPVKTGDIFVRLSNATYLGIPFSKLIARFSNSRWSHASIAMVEDYGIYLVEISDAGTLEYRFIDWVDYCTSGEFAIYRLKTITPDLQLKLHQEINEFLLEDPEYDFTFDSSDKYYCTKSVVSIYKKFGIILQEPQLIKDIVPGWFYKIFSVVNWPIRHLLRKGFDPDVPVYFVGNAERGLLASPLLEQVYGFSLSSLLG